MKALVAALIALSATSAHAASISEIFQSIADATSAGNGSGHTVEQRDPAKYSEKKEIAQLKREVRGVMDCRFDVYADTKGALNEMEHNWEASESAARLEGMNNKGLIRQIIYSDWDPSTGDSEYCSISIMKVFAVDGTVLNLEFNETD